VGLIVRPYRPIDFAAVAAVYARAKLDEFRYETAHFVLVPLEEDVERLAAFALCDVIVCECDGMVAGFAASSDDTLRALFVAPEARGQGVGWRLLQSALASLPGDVRLSVATSNAPACELYRRAGFRVTGTFDNSYNGTAVGYTTMLLAQPGRQR
jgi:putative acetyltransferase